MGSVGSMGLLWKKEIKLLLISLQRNIGKELLNQKKVREVLKEKNNYKVVWVVWVVWVIVALHHHICSQLLSCLRTNDTLDY